MTRRERMEEIRAYLKQNRSATITELSDKLGVSHMTVRRDLGTLALNDPIKVIHGGVVYRETVEKHGDSYSLAEALTEMYEEKHRIAQKAVSLLRERDIIIIDAGSTGELIARLLPDSLTLTVICYALNIATIVSQKPNCSLIVAGGYFHHGSMVLESDEGLAFLKQNRATKSFVTSSGVNFTLGVTCSNFFERATKQAVISSAETRILVADSSKFGVVKSGYFAKVEDFDIIITDCKLKKEEHELLSRLENTTVYCV